MGRPLPAAHGDVTLDNIRVALLVEPVPIPAPDLTDVTVSNTVIMAFDSLYGIDYSVEYTETLNPANWEEAGLVITGDDNTRFIYHPVGVSTNRQYRLRVLP